MESRPLYLVTRAIFGKDHMFQGMLRVIGFLTDTV